MYTSKNGSLLNVIIHASILMQLTSSAQAQYTNLACTWTDKSIEVYFNPGTIAANGFDVARFREEMIDGMSVWNDEGQGRYDLLYMGDTTSNQKAGAIVVNHIDTWACSDNTIGKAFYPGAGAECDSGDPVVNMVMQDSCNPGTPRDWRTGWPGTTFNPWGLGGAAGYEMVAAHEFMHMQGLPDEGPGPGMGCCTNWHTSFRFLYPIDVLSIRAQAGPTIRRPRTVWSTLGTSWSSSSLLSTNYSSSPPDLDGMGGTGLSAAIWEPVFQVANVRTGNHGSWTNVPTPTSIGDLHKWPSIASSSFGESLVVWPDDCDNTNACTIDWAWTNNGGTSWTTGTLSDARTHSKAFVQYDQNRDRFVLAYIHRNDARIMTRSTAAASVSWGNNHPTIAVPYRHLGGMVFDGDGAGLLVAASDQAATKGQIAQFAFTVTGTSYGLVNGSWATSPAGAAKTRRPFGIARSPYSQRVVMVWRDVGNPRSMAVSRKLGIGSSIAFDAPTFPIADISNGASIAFDAFNDRFVAGYAQ